MTQAQRIVLVVAMALLIWLAGYTAGSFASRARAEQTAAHVASPGPADSQRNLEIRAKLEEAWYAELNGTIPSPQREYLRRYRRLENRYFIWRRIEPNGLVIELAARYVRHRYASEIIQPPEAPTIGPVRYYPGYGWGPGLGQKRPSWYTLARPQQHHSKVVWATSHLQRWRTPEIIGRTDSVQVRVVVNGHRLPEGNDGMTIFFHGYGVLASVTAKTQSAPLTWRYSADHRTKLRLVYWVE